jgi:hypothetical protein
MLKAFSKLTRTKSTPPTEDQIVKHNNKKQARDVWRKDVDKLKAIITGLDKEYSLHKGDFALARYEQLKTMIKLSVAQCSEVTGANHNNRDALSSASMRAGEPADGTNATARLRDTAAHFARTLPRGGRVESELSGKELEQETEALHRETVELKHEFRTLRDKLKVLGLHYTESKHLLPDQRYVALKNMIKTAVTANA